MYKGATFVTPFNFITALNEETSRSHLELGQVYTEGDEVVLKHMT